MHSVPPQLGLDHILCIPVHESIIVFDLAVEIHSIPQQQGLNFLNVKVCFFLIFILIFLMINLYV